MIYIIQTIGQRDVQMHYKTDRDDYSSFEKKELAQIQAKLSEFSNDDKLKWKPIEGREGRQERSAIELENSSKEICFPFTEKIIKTLSDKEKYVFVLLFTDRQRANIDKSFIRNEPWIFAQIIRDFWDSIISHYKINAELLLINICKTMQDNWDINAEFAYKRMDEISQFLISSKKVDAKDKIQVYNSGGMPIIAQALDMSLDAYFPKQAKFMEQNFGKITESKQHLIRMGYSLKFSILQKLKQFDFTGAYRDALELQMKQKEPELFSLLTIANSWLYQESKKTISLIDEYLRNSQDKEISKNIEVMKDMLKEKNAVGCNLLRTIQEAHKSNWWSMSTLLISVGELFIIEKIRDLFPKAIINKYNRIWFDIRKIPSNISIPAEKQSRLVSYSDKNLYNTNWEMFDYVIQSDIKPEYKNDFKKLYDFLVSLRSIKNARNAFIHQGVSISKVKLNKSLKLNTNLKSLNINFNSNTFSYLIEELEKMSNITFINWVPIIQEELIERVKEFSPIQ